MTTGPGGVFDLGQRSPHGVTLIVGTRLQAAATSPTGASSRQSVSETAGRKWDIVYPRWDRELCCAIVIVRQSRTAARYWVRGTGRGGTRGRMAAMFAAALLLGGARPAV